MNLLQLVGQPLFAAELVLVQREDELLVVFDGVLIQLMERAVQVKLVGVKPALLGQHCVHILIRDDRHGFDVGVVPVHPVLVHWDVFGIEKFGARGILAQNVLGRGAGVHKGLSCHAQTTVYDVGFAHIKDKVRILDQVDPESERQRVAFPSVNHLVVRDPVLESLVVEEVE